MFTDRNEAGEQLADPFIYLATPEQFWAISQFYWDFDQVSDEEVGAYFSKNAGPLSPTQPEPSTMTKI